MARLNSEIATKPVKDDACIREHADISYGSQNCIAISQHVKGWVGVDKDNRREYFIYCQHAEELLDIVSENGTCPHV